MTAQATADAIRTKPLRSPMRMPDLQQSLPEPTPGLEQLRSSRFERTSLYHEIVLTRLTVEGACRALEMCGQHDAEAALYIAFGRLDIKLQSILGY